MTTIILIMLVGVLVLVTRNGTYQQLTALTGRCDQFATRLGALTAEGAAMAATAAAILDQVRAQKTVLDGLKLASDTTIAFEQDIKAKLDAAIAGNADPATFQAISDELGANTAEAQQTQDALSAAIVANTAAATETPNP